MSNQVILWSTFIVPWLTLFLMKKEDIKRLLPAGLLAALASVIIYEAGVTYHWVIIKEMAYPLHMPPALIGLHPVIIMWILKFTYKKFWWFAATELVANLGFVFLFLGYFLAGRDIIYVNAKWLLFLFATALGFVLYVYQIWQETIFKNPYRNEKNSKH